MLIAPVKSKNTEIILFILTFEEVNQSPESKYNSKGPRRSRFLQQIGIPLISSIFSRNYSSVNLGANSALFPGNKESFNFIYQIKFKLAN